MTFAIARASGLTGWDTMNSSWRTIRFLFTDRMTPRRLSSTHFPQPSSGCRCAPCGPTHLHPPNPAVACATLKSRARPFVYRDVETSSLPTCPCCPVTYCHPSFRPSSGGQERQPEQHHHYVCVRGNSSGADDEFQRWYHVGDSL